jgi:hypothetical protein
MLHLFGVWPEVGQSLYQTAGCRVKKMGHTGERAINGYALADIGRTAEAIVKSVCDSSG